MTGKKLLRLAWDLRHVTPANNVRHCTERARVQINHLFEQHSNFCTLGKFLQSLRPCISADTGLSRRANEMFPHGKNQEIRISFQSEFLHNPILVERNGARSDVENICRFLHALSFG